MEVESAVKIFLSSADIGIIGGADGPTAVFVARSFFPWLAIAALILLCLAVYLFLHRGSPEVAQIRQREMDEKKAKKN